MTLNQLRVFWTVGSSGGISAAARVLFMSQPSVTGHLRALEKSLRVKLYDRRDGGFVLTDAGEALMRHADTIIRAEHEALETINSIRGSFEGRLRIGTNTTGGMYVLPQILRRFQADFPNVKIALYIDHSPAVVESVLHGTLDVGFAGGPIDNRRLSVHRTGQEELVLIASPDRGVPDGGTLTLADLAEQPLIVPEVGTRSRWLIETRLREVGVPFKVALSMKGTEAVKKAVEADLGIAFVSEYSVEREVYLGALRLLTVEGFQIVRALEMFCRRGTKFPAIAAPLLDYVAAFVNAPGPHFAPSDAEQDTGEGVLRGGAGSHVSSITAMKPTPEDGRSAGQGTTDLESSGPALTGG